MAGWQGEAEADDIDGYAEHTVNNEGKREYQIAFEATMELKEKGAVTEELQASIIRDPKPPTTDNYGRIGPNTRKSHEASQRLADIRRWAVSHALQGLPPSYEK